MDLSIQAIHDVIHPTAIFGGSMDRDGRREAPDTGLDPLWEHSQLNPKNRTDSLDPPANPLWRIDGCAGHGTQFYAVPLFLEGAPPVRFDLFISEDATESPLIRNLLDMNAVFHTRDRVRLQRKGICSYILRALQAWTVRGGHEEVKKLYYEAPFGSRIVFTNLPLKVEDVQIQFDLQSNLERCHKTAHELAQMWRGSSQTSSVLSMPPAVNVYDLVLVEQLHDSVCVIRYREPRGSDEGHEAALWVLKALTSSVKYMYHEMRVLLAMPPHPNIIERPTRIVTKRAYLNQKRETVVGFLVPFYAGGGLRDELPLLRVNNRLRLDEQTLWATAICSAMRHIVEKGGSYYPDLRLDQIVFAAGRKRPIIVDFEQRGVWCEFGAPEVNAIEHLLTLAAEENARAEEGDESASAGLDVGVEGTRPSPRRFCDLARRIDPDFDPRRISQADSRYRGPAEGYNVSWLSLAAHEREFAMVYMLGRLLWCVFEGMAAPQRGAIWQSYPREPEYEFPEFRRTPDAVRALILRCTRGRRAPLSRRIVRRGSRIVLRDDEGARGDGTPQDVRAAARAFWMAEVRWAEDFVLRRERGLADGTWERNHFARPTLAEVAERLESYQSELAMRQPCAPYR